jgi:molybdopterin adenylyltransferase
MNMKDVVRIGLLSVSDRAAQGVYPDRGLPALKEWLTSAIINPIEFTEKIIADEQALIASSLVELCDHDHCALVFTTGGTGPALRDVTPEATLAVATKSMPGFGEQMRAISLNFVPTAILSRQVAVIRNQTLIINLPGQPKSIREILGGIEGRVAGIFAAVPYCIDLLLGPFIETHANICTSFRPSSAKGKSPIDKDKR